MRVTAAAVVPDVPLASAVVDLDAEIAQLGLQIVRQLVGAPALGRMPLRHEGLDLLAILPGQGEGWGRGWGRGRGWG